MSVKKLLTKLKYQFRIPKYLSFLILANLFHSIVTHQTKGSVCLSQLKNGVLRPVLYGRRTLTASKLNYATLDKELLAIFFAVKRCYVYLFGHDFIVYTDHQPLMFLSSFKDIINKRFR